MFLFVFLIAVLFVNVDSEYDEYVNSKETLFMRAYFLLLN